MRYSGSECSREDYDAPAIPTRIKAVCDVPGGSPEQRREADPSQGGDSAECGWWSLGFRPAQDRKEDGQAADREANAMLADVDRDPRKQQAERRTVSQLRW